MNRESQHNITRRTPHILTIVNVEIKSIIMCYEPRLTEVPATKFQVCFWKLLVIYQTLSLSLDEKLKLMFYASLRCRAKTSVLNKTFRLPDD